MKTILFSLLFVAIALIIALSQSRGHHRNGYAKSKRRVRTILKSENDLGIIGDGAWLTTSSRRARTHPARHIEPRGA